MSRCFPYPPPGYLRQGLVHESIKLEREKVVPKTEQKLHKKREKKEKKKEKKGKDKTQSPNKKIKKLDDVISGFKDDQIEKSDLTVEHGPPVCYTSDGNQNSPKRKRETVSSREFKVDGNKIKIRFSFKKPRVNEASVNEETVCSSSVRVESAQEQNCTIGHVPEQNLRHDGLSMPEQMLRHIELSVPEQKMWHDDGTKEQGSSLSRRSSRRSSKDKKMPKAALQYKMLFENWMSPLLQLEQNDDDWLFSIKAQGKPAAKRTDEDDVTCRPSATSFPHAHFLQEAVIYALPYTVPF